MSSFKQFRHKRGPMAYDYLAKIRINRPLTEEEVGRRIDVHRPVVDDAADAYTVFGMNDIYLEVCDALTRGLAGAFLPSCFVSRHLLSSLWKPLRVRLSIRRQWSGTVNRGCSAPACGYSS